MCPTKLASRSPHFLPYPLIYAVLYEWKLDRNRTFFCSQNSISRQAAEEL